MLTARRELEDLADPVPAVGADQDRVLEQAQWCPVRVGRGIRHVAVAGQAHRLAFLARAEAEERGDRLVEVAERVTVGRRPADRAVYGLQRPVAQVKQGR